MAEGYVSLWESLDLIVYSNPQVKMHANQETPPFFNPIRYTEPHNVPFI